MRLMPLALFLVAAPALADDVLWLSPPSDALREQVLGVEGGAEVTRADLLPTDAAWGPADEAALAGLEAGLTDAREYETRLDGELVIMQSLAVPIAAVRALRDEEDRKRLHAALAYQGFAVDRFFGDDLGADERAADFRVALDSKLLPSPWVAAIALEPERAVSPYEIADAPSRVRYEALRGQLGDALPALLAPTVPEGVTLVVDGRPTEITATGTVKLPPGRHLVHAEIDGRIVQRWTLELAPAARENLVVAVDPAALDGWLGALPSAPPRFAAESMAARGGLLIVDPSTDKAFRVGPDGSVTEEAIPEAPKPEKEASDRDGGLGVGLAVGGGWFGSQDFYLVDPINRAPTAGTVNAAAIGLGADITYDIGVLRLAAAMDLAMPVGADHTTLVESTPWRVRPTPMAAVGLRQAQIAVGYVLPHHMALGGRLTLPVTDQLEIRGSALAGLPPKRTRADGSSWQGEALGTAWLGVGWRFGG
ncbi:MAG: hypothetical protein EP330_25300 [Deltaproteobacteria bacterium]|nr:MAG: hypothetical protein EP330_25300 [Deltaproteobacteria bacterium]